MSPQTSCTPDSSPLSLDVSRYGEPPVVAVLVLAEPEDAAVLVEVRPGGAAAAWSGPAGAAGLPPTALGPGCSRCVAPQHHPSALPFLQVGLLPFFCSFRALEKHSW